MANKRSTIQTNIKTNRKNYNKFSYWLQGIDVTQQNLDQFNPYIKGVSRIFMYHPPYFMAKGYPEETANFKSYVETGFTKIDGIQDVSVEFVEFEGGFNGQKFSNVSSAKDDTDTLTISLYEQSGRPVGEFLETWISGVRDLRSGIAHYHGIDVPYSEKYHTAEFIYLTLDPTGKEIEYACMFAHAFPTKVEKGHLNYEKGDRDNVLMDVEFRVTKYESTYINQVAQWYLAMDKIKYKYLDFDPGITQSNVKAAYSLALA